MSHHHIPTGASSQGNHKRKHPLRVAKNANVLKLNAAPNKAATGQSRNQNDFAKGFPRILNATSCTRFS
jgi:hypothetical protein